MQLAQVVLLDQVLQAVHVQPNIMMMAPLLVASLVTILVLHVQMQFHVQLAIVVQTVEH